VNSFAVAGELSQLERYHLGVQLAALPQAEPYEPTDRGCWQTAYNERSGRGHRPKSRGNRRSVSKRATGIGVA
jgi:hypothetical protein